MNLSLKICGMLSVLVFVSAAKAADAPKTALAAGDAKSSALETRKAIIFGDVHHTHQLEIRLSKLGAETTKMAEVKSMSTEMVADHEKADAELVSLSQKENVTLASFNAADSEQGVMDALKKLDGPAFDLAYLDFQRDTHAALAGKLKLLIAEEKYAPTKKMLQSILPTVEHHEKMSATLQKKAMAMK